MAYSSTSNPPNRIDAGILSQRNIRESTSVAEGSGLWTYNSSDAFSVLQGSGYFDNAGDLGMRNGDILLASIHSTEASSGHSVCIGVIAFDTTAAASLSTGGTFTSTGYGG
jgi:hypothetical protein